MKRGPLHSCNHTPSWEGSEKEELSPLFYNVGMSDQARPAGRSQLDAVTQGVVFLLLSLRPTLPLRHSFLVLPGKHHRKRGYLRNVVMMMVQNAKLVCVLDGCWGCLMRVFPNPARLSGSRCPCHSLPTQSKQTAATISQLREKKRKKERVAARSKVLFRSPFMDGCGQ